MADKADAGEACPVAVVAGEGLVWDGNRSHTCLPPVPFLLEAVHAVFFDRGHGLVDGLTPCVTVCIECRPLVMVNVAGTKSLSKSVFVPLLRSPYVAMARGEFAIQSDLGQAMIFHPGDVSYPA